MGNWVGHIAPLAATLHEVLAEFPNLLLGSYPYFDNRLASKDTTYLERAHTFMV